MSSRILASLVTWNDEADLGRCLDSLLAQDVDLEVRVLDNASSDRTCEVAERYEVHLTRSPENRGYSAGHNANIAASSCSECLLLNADVSLEPGFLTSLSGALGSDDSNGMAGGKLLRMGKEGNTVLRDGLPVLDSTGIYFTPSQRHFDRGSNQLDLGQFDQTERVFGITGAALLCKRSFIDDISIDGEFLDEDFFAYREDADLAWRAQLRGWSAIYVPDAVALHRRVVLPERRREVSPAANYHSVKNRFLMRTKNMDRSVALRCFPWAFARDLGILMYLPLFEPRSLPALWEAWRLRPRMKAKRRDTQGGRRVDGQKLAGWFSFEPQSRPTP